MDITPKTQLLSKAEALATTPPDFRAAFGGMRGYNVKETSLPGSKLESQGTGTAQIADLSVTTGKIASSAITLGKFAYEVVTVTISAGQPSGTASVTSGSIILGWYPNTNLDQIVKNVSVSGTTVTVNLLANATATTTILVVLLKA